MPEIQETNKGTGIKGKSTTRQANTGKLTLLTYTQGNDDQLTINTLRQGKK